MKKAVERAPKGKNIFHITSDWLITPRFVVENLKEELRSKRPTTSHGNEWEKEKAALEVQLYRSE